MKASSRTRVILVVILTAFVLLPAFQVPSSMAESGLSLSYEFDFPEPYVDLGTPERLYSITGLELDGRGGVPTLPVRSIFLAVPPGHHMSAIDVKCASPQTMGFVQRYPTNPAEMTLNGELSFSYDYRGLPYEVTNTYVLEGVEVICLDLYPLYWNEWSGALSFVSGYTITLTFEKGLTDYMGNLDRVRDLVDNPQVVPDLPRSTTSSLLPSGEHDHLIITSQELSVPFAELARWKGERNELGSVHQDIRSTVVTLDDILGNSQFWGDPRSHGGTGNDTQTIIRNFIIAAHQEWGVQYVLLGGDDDVLPVRLLDAPMYDEDFDVLPGDIYYSGLDGNWDSDGDGVYGELTGLLGKDEADLLAEVFVGRATVSTEKQAWNLVNKTIAYEKGYSNQYGKDVLLVGEYLDAQPTYGDDYKEEVWNLVLADEGLDRSTLYARSGTFSGPAVLAAMNTDVHVINHMGHGNFDDMFTLSNSDIQGLHNELPFILYSQTCLVAGFDEKTYAPGDSIAEEFVQGENGTVAFIGNSRFGWYSPGSTAGSSQKFDISFFSQVYDDDVTDLGRALSYSKEEWAGSASYAGSVRWVYLELNLLGDPETRVHVPGRAVHDLAVLNVDPERPMLGETGPITVRVQNRGQSDDDGTLRLLVDDTLTGSVPFSLGPGESTNISVEWTPAEQAVVTITAQLVSALDQRHDNDVLVVRTMVDRRVNGDEIWTGNRTLRGGLLIEDLVTVDMVNGNITLQPSDLPFRFTVMGGLSLNGSTLQGSPFFIESEGGDLEILSSGLAGMSTASISTMSGGSLNVRDTTIEGGAGWILNGTSVGMFNTTLRDQTGEWRLSNSSADLERLMGQEGDGVRLRNMTGSIVSSSWTGGSSGLSVDRCTGITLRDLSFTNNGMDLGIFGDQRVHFEHHVENVSLTYGPLQILQGLNDQTVENATGSLYLIGCRDIVVRSSRLAGSGNGLALVECSRIEIVGNSFENNTVGILSLGSDGLAWGNDLLFNDRQAVLVHSNLTFGKEYPIGGNHWSDMTGTDTKGGEAQKTSGADGMFDTAYDSGDIRDRYPKVGRCSLVHDLLDASFTFDAEQANRADALKLTSDSRSGIGIANSTWDLGDGDHAYGTSVTHTYRSLGTVTVRLNVTDHYGRVDSAERVIQVVNLNPLGDFGVTPKFPGPGETVRFQDLSVDRDGAVVSWHWDFGDGNVSDLPSPEHVFEIDDDYMVTLTVNDADGGSDTVSRILAVGNEPPVAYFTWNPTLVTILVDVQFQSMSTDPDGTVVSWSWNFGDGRSGSGSTVRHKYSALGTYTVTLIVTDEDGATSSLARSLTVSNSRPVAAFSAPSQVESLLVVQFKDLSYDPDGNLKGWNWNFGDGGASNMRSPSHIYLRSGIFTVDLTVTDDRGGTAKASSTVTVINRLPEVNITAPLGNHSSLDVLEFCAYGHDRDGTVVSYVWNMGDGTVLEGANVTHAYRAPGNYNVTVTCWDDSGGNASNSSEITVHNLDPRAAVRVEHGDHPLELVFIAQADDDDGEIISYNWSFGDGNFGTGPTVNHRYSQAGDYDVELSVTDDMGATGDLESGVEVRLANVSLSEAALIGGWKNGWTFSGNIINQGAVPVHVTLSIEAKGIALQKEYDVGGNSSTSVELALDGLEAGNVTVKLLTPEGWDADQQDNVWTGFVESEETFPYWLIGAGILAIAAVGTVLFFRRR